MSFLPNPFDLISGGVDFLTKRRKPEKVSRFDEGQTELNRLLEEGAQGRGPFAQFFTFDPQQVAQGFEQEVGAPLRQEFAEQTVPTITGQFRGGNLQNSTFSGQALGRASEGLDRQLASGLAQQQRQAKQSAFDNINKTVDRQTFDLLKTDPSILEQIIPRLVEMLAKAGAA